MLPQRVAVGETVVLSLRSDVCYPPGPPARPLLRSLSLMNGSGRGWGAQGRVRNRISPTPYASPLDVERMGRDTEEGLAATWGIPAAIPIGPEARRTGRSVCVDWPPPGRRSK